MPRGRTYEPDRLALAAADGDFVAARARDWPRGRKYEVELEAVIEGGILPDEKAER